MKIKKHLLVIFIVFLTTPILAKDYKASFFGIKSDGITMNTRSIQYGIDYISSHGGGRLVFYVGKYLTGSIHLKSNVTIHLEEGAVLLGSTNPFDYDKIKWAGFILADGQENIGITGKGMIDGQGRKVANNFVDNAHYGLLEKDSLKYDRVSEVRRPMIIYFWKCKNVKIKDITLKNSAAWCETYNQCENLLVDNITVINTAYWNSDGIDIVDCNHVVIKNSYIDAADDGICLKSHHEDAFCNDILAENNVVRTSANGIKLGTAGLGGFQNIKFINNTVYNTYRSAVALESVDGGFLKNVLVDSLKSINNGNVIFLRLGDRKGNNSSMEGITIKNVTAVVPSEKPDAGYEYDGPIEDQPRNISPAIIISGLPGQYIKDLTFSNIKITHPGKGDPYFAKIDLDSLNTIPEFPEKYPEFSMFKELPAWGVFIRHAKNIKFSNIKLDVEKEGYRMPVVLDDTHDATFSNFTVNGSKKDKMYYKNESSNIQFD